MSSDLNLIELVSEKLWLVRTLEHPEEWHRVQQTPRRLICSCENGRRGLECGHKERAALYRSEKAQWRAKMPIALMRAVGAPSDDVIKFLNDHVGRIGPVTEQQKG